MRLHLLLALALRAAALVGPLPCRPLRCTSSIAPTRVPLAALSARSAVVTDMDETLISKKSTGFVIEFCKQKRAFVRLAFALPLALLLIPLSKFSRALAVRVMYWLAFRGVRVDVADKIAAGALQEQYVRDLQDPAATALLAADDKVVITASPVFMARPWLERYLGVPAANVYGAELEQKNGRFTGKVLGEIPISEAKVDLLKNSVAAADGSGRSATATPDRRAFLACDKGVLVHEPAQLIDQLRRQAGVHAGGAIPATTRRADRSGRRLMVLFGARGR